MKLIRDIEKRLVEFMQKKFDEDSYTYKLSSQKYVPVKPSVHLGTYEDISPAFMPKTAPCVLIQPISSSTESADGFVYAEYVCHMCVRSESIVGVELVTPVDDGLIYVPGKGERPDSQRARTDLYNAAYTLAMQTECILSQALIDGVCMISSMSSDYPESIMVKFPYAEAVIKFSIGLPASSQMIGTKIIEFL